ncbi:MAG: polysaccharide deacetylase family protein, partial [Solirubrobacterales bacterium]|nr:polysaccharide deacetylase family protein [Solirubrobacterales bacterium]
STVTGAATGTPGNTPVPILMYHVIAPPPPGAPFPGLYVPEPEFAAQMHALKTGGWHAVTLDQVEAYWKRGVPLGPGKPIVISFDNGYHSQYANAFPVLKQLGWVGDENIQLTGLPPSQGGMTHSQVRGLLDAGWELDTQGISHADLITLDASQLRYQVASARRILQRRYGVPVNWFCYPSGHYNANVIAEVKAAGFVGSTTVVPGWASPAADPYRLPRVRVSAGTSPQALLSQIADSQSASAPPQSYPGG